jgi:hypothetical protein
MIYYDGKEWRDAEEMLEMAGRESQEKYDKVASQLEKDGVL